MPKFRVQMTVDTFYWAYAEVDAEDEDKAADKAYALAGKPGAITWELADGCDTTRPDVGEIEEVLVQACPYVGFPAIALATTAAIEALREAGIDPLTKTSEERGLL